MMRDANKATKLPTPIPLPHKASREYLNQVIGVRGKEYVKATLYKYIYNCIH